MGFILDLINLVSRPLSKSIKAMSSLYRLYALRICLAFSVRVLSRASLVHITVEAQQAMIVIKENTNNRMAPPRDKWSDAELDY